MRSKCSFFEVTRSDANKIISVKISFLLKKTRDEIAARQKVEAKTECSQKAGSKAEEGAMLILPLTNTRPFNNID